MQDDLVKQAQSTRPSPCTCHPDDRPTGPCPQLYAASDCQKAARITALEAKLATAVEALEVIAEGDYPMPHHDIYRQDGAHSKHDRCPHGEWMYDGCDQCCADFARQALATLKEQSDG